MDDSFFTPISILLIVVVLAIVFVVSRSALFKFRQLAHKILTIFIHSPVVASNLSISNANIIAAYVLKEKQKIAAHPYKIFISKAFRDFNILCWMLCGRSSKYNLIEPTAAYRTLLILECIVIQFLGTDIISVLYPLTKKYTTSISLFTDSFIRSLLVGIAIQPFIIAFLILSNAIYLKQMKIILNSGKKLKEIVASNSNICAIIKGNFHLENNVHTRGRLLSDDKICDAIKEEDISINYSQFAKAIDDSSMRIYHSPVCILHYLYLLITFLCYAGISNSRGGVCNKSNLIIKFFTMFLDFGFYRVASCLAIAGIKLCMANKSIPLPMSTYSLKNSTGINPKIEVKECNAQTEINLPNQIESTITNSVLSKMPRKEYDKSINVSGINLLNEKGTPIKNADEAIEMLDIKDASHIRSNEECNYHILKEMVATLTPAEINQVITNWRKANQKLELEFDHQTISQISKPIENAEIKKRAIIDSDNNELNTYNDNDNIVEEEKGNNNNNDNIVEEGKAPEFLVHEPAENNHAEEVVKDKDSIISESGIKLPNKDATTLGALKNDSCVQVTARDIIEDKCKKPSIHLRNMENKGLFTAAPCKDGDISIDAHQDNSELSSPDPDLSKMQCAPYPDASKLRNVPDSHNELNTTTIETDSKPLKNMENKGISKLPIKDCDPIKIIDNDDAQTPKHYLSHNIENISPDSIMKKEKAKPLHENKKDTDLAAIISSNLHPAKLLRQQMFDLENSVNNCEIKLSKKRLKKKNQCISKIKDTFSDDQKIEQSNCEKHSESDKIDSDTIKFDDNDTNNNEKVIIPETEVFYPKEDMTNYSLNLGLNKTTKKSLKHMIYSTDSKKDVFRSMAQCQSTKEIAKRHFSTNPVDSILEPQIKKITSQLKICPFPIKRGTLLPPKPVVNIPVSYQNGEQISPYEEDLVRRFDPFGIAKQVIM